MAKASYTFLDNHQLKKFLENKIYIVKSAFHSKGLIAAKNDIVTFMLTHDKTKHTRYAYFHCLDSFENTFHFNNKNYMIKDKSLMLVPKYYLSDTYFTDLDDIPYSEIRKQFKVKLSVQTSFDSVFGKVKL